MADTGGIGKGIAGCSCLSILFFLVFSVFLRFGLTMLIEAVPEAATYAGILTGPVALITNGCCCLSGFGMIVGIVLIAMGGKGDDEL